MTKKVVIIDTDPGIDDAVALAFALFSDKIEVPLITTVAGNVGIEYVTTNALKLLAFYQKKIPVAKGATRPLLRLSKDAGSVHGETGLAGFAFDELAQNCLVGEHAVIAMYQELLKREKTTILAIGPLTNIALLLRLYPDVIHRIDEVVLMGGAIGRGNYGVYTEFNIGFDPEAAHIVFNAPVKKVMLGLEIGNQAILTESMTKDIRSSGRIGEMFYSLFAHYRGEWLHQGLEIYDSTAIGYILHPEFYTVQPAFIDIEIKGEKTAGATLVDFHALEEQNAMVATAVNVELFSKWFVEDIKQMQLL